MALQMIARVIFAALVYFASARLGVAFAIPHGITTLWPPSGVMLAVLVLSERRYWPALLAGAFAGGMLSDLQSGYPLPLAAAAMAVSCAESLLAAWIVTWRFTPADLLSSLSGLFRFVVGAVLMGNAVTACLGALVFHVRLHETLGDAWFSWWIGDGLGMVIVAPVILAWAHPTFLRRPIRPLKVLEATLLLSLLVATAIVAFGPSRGWALEPDPDLVFPLLIWAAFSFGPAGAATASLIVAGVATWNTGLGVGPFSSPGPLGLNAELEVYTFLLMASLATLIPAAVRQERLRTLRRLEDSQERYRDLFEFSPDPQWVYDIDTRRFLAVNHAAVEQYGFSNAEFLRMSIFDIRPEEEVPRLIEDLGQVGSADIIEQVWRHRRKDGTVIEVEVSSHQLVFDGRPARLVHAQDVTQRRNADDALRSAQERLRQVLGSSGAVIFEMKVKDDRIKLEWISDNVTRILGYTVEETYQPDWWLSAVHPDDLLRMSARPGLEAYRDGTVEYRLRNKDGRYRWLRDELRVTRDANGRLVSVVGAWLDITDSRQLEQQIQQSQKMEAIGQLAGGVAHDFNNILTVILAESDEVLTHGSLAKEEDRESLEEIRRSAERAAGLTRQLLTFSRRQIVAPATLDLNEIVGGMDKMLGRLIGEHIRVVRRLAPDLRKTIADRGQIEQVLVNLVVNARDAMPGGGSLTIETGNVQLDESYTGAHPGVGPGGYVMLAVSDVGTGMTPDVQSHLFEPFFTTKPPGKGTGLGLATCYAIAQQSGGHISAYSEPGLGTTMRVYLPSTEFAAHADAPDTQPAAPTGRRETILLVEDEVGVRRVTSRMLQAAGYQVHEVASGEEATAFLEGGTDRFDLLLTDVVLPGIGGSALAERVTRLRPGIRTLFASGYSDDTVLQHRLLEHGVVLLQKPFTAATLSNKVREALEKRV